MSVDFRRSAELVLGSPLSDKQRASLESSMGKLADEDATLLTAMMMSMAGAAIKGNVSAFNALAGFAGAGGQGSGQREAKVLQFVQQDRAKRHADAKNSA